MSASRTGLLACLLLSAAASAQIPVGLDAYRLWERWPYQRIGVRAYMRSTYDRARRQRRRRRHPFPLPAGRRLQRDARRRRPGRPLLRPLQPLARQPVALRGGWHRPPRAGDQHRRSATIPRPTRSSCPQAAFPTPLAWTWSDTKGADLIVGADRLREVFRMAYSRTLYGTGYYIYHQYVPGAKLSRPIRAWNDEAARPRTCWT